MARLNSVDEVLAALPGRFRPEHAGDMQAVFQFDLTGDEGGQWQAGIANGQLQVTPGLAENPNVTVSLPAKDFLALVNGELNAMQAFMLGKVKVKGDMALVMKMQKLFAWN